MGKIAFLFAGQGAQAPGMGESLCEKSPAAAAVFRQIVEPLRPGTFEQCVSGSKEELSQTINTQPCMFAVDLAAARALQEAGVEPDVVAGFSLGELPALAVAGVLDDEDAFSFVCKRGEYMDECAQQVDGAMAAVLGASREAVEEVCLRHNVYPVNYNCPGQIVISGEREAVEAARAEFKEARVKSLPLPVSGAFHTPYMEAASQQLALVVQALPCHAPTIEVYSNYTARPYKGGGEVAMENIVRQVKEPVRWQETIEHMAQSGVTTFIEVGPGKTLSGFVRKTIPEAQIFNVNDAVSLKATIEGLA